MARKISWTPGKIFRVWKAMFRPPVSENASRQHKQTHPNFFSEHLSHVKMVHICLQWFTVLIPNLPDIYVMLRFILHSWNFKEPYGIYFFQYGSWPNTIINACLNYFLTCPVCFCSVGRRLPLVVFHLIAGIPLFVTIFIPEVTGTRAEHFMERRT